MIRIISDVCFLCVVVHWWCIITTTTAWTNLQRAQHFPYKWTSSQVHHSDDSSTPTIRQQQQQQQKGLSSSKTDDTTLIEAAATTSETSIKVRALASFISMNMLEPMLAAGVPIEKIMSMTSSSSSLDSSSSVSDDTVDTVETRSTTTSLHQKEGDRIVSIKDTFDTGDSAPTIPLPPPTAVIVDGHDDGTVHNSEAPTTNTGTPPLSPTTVEPRPSTFSSSDVLLIPTIPSVISTAFGRPLSVVQENVPPLQQPQQMTTTSSMEDKVSPLQQPHIVTTTTTTTTTIEENAPSLQPPRIMTTTTIVSDEDPYGE